MAEKNSPKLSIGVPVYNAEKFLAQTLEGLLTQTFTDYEIIISDNASTDTTQAICEEFVARDSRIRYIRSPKNHGAAWNFNKTVKSASGQYFKWAAHDDLHEPTFLQRCIEILDDHPDVVLCFTGTTFIDADGNTLRTIDYPVDLYNAPRWIRFRYFAVGGHIVHEVFGVIRARELRNTDLIGGYLGSDLVLLAQLALQGKIYRVPEQLFLHREHSERSMINPQGAANATQWYDAAKSGAFVMPYWRRAFENLKSIFLLPMPATDRVACSVELARACWWNIKYLTREVWSVFARP